MRASIYKTHICLVSCLKFFKRSFKVLGVTFKVLHDLILDLLASVVLSTSNPTPPAPLFASLPGTSRLLLLAWLCTCCLCLPSRVSHSLRGWHLLLEQEHPLRMREEPLLWVPHILCPSLSVALHSLIPSLKPTHLTPATCESAALNMPENLENSAVATGLEKVSFHSNPKERQSQRMLKLPHNCTHLTR